MSGIIQDRLERLLSEDFKLRYGAGTGINGEVDVCIMQAVDWLAGGSGKTDHPKCASLKIADYCIALNDSPLFAEHRRLLKPYAPKIVGTAGPNGDREVRRAYCLADYAVRKFAPIWLRAHPEHKFDADASKLEVLAPITDEATRNAARQAAADAAYAAASAAYAAYAAYAAGGAADAADAAYAADAADAASAASAVSAAYADVDVARTKVLTEKGDELRALALEALDAVLAVR